MDNRQGLKALPVRESNLCFGCSPMNPYGLQMRFHTNGEALFSWVTVPPHLCGWKDLVHGGVITAMLDEIMGWSALYFLKSFILTKSIAVDFLKPVYAGKSIRVEGRLAAARSEREAEMEALLYDCEGKLCSRAVGVFALFSPEKALEMGICDETVLRDLEILSSS